MSKPTRDAELQRHAAAAAHRHIEGAMLPDLQLSFRLFAAHRRKVGAGWTFPEHSHSLYEINLVLDGVQLMQVEGTQREQRSGDLLWLLPGMKHASLGAAGGGTMEYMCLHFAVDDPWLRHQLNQLAGVHYRADSPLTAALRPALDAWLEAIRDANGEPQLVRLQTMSASFRLFAALSGYLTASRALGAAEPAAVRRGAGRRAGGAGRRAGGAGAQARGGGDARAAGARSGGRAGQASAGGARARGHGADERAAGAAEGAAQGGGTARGGTRPTGSAAAGAAGRAAAQAAAPGSAPAASAAQRPARNADGAPAAAHGKAARPLPTSASELAGRLAASIEALVLHAGEADADAAKRGIEQLARRLGYTAAHCSRVFQSAYGMSPRQYLSMVKLRQAKLLLMDSELSVEQVATRLGYHDVSQFSKQFKRWTNLSPSAYRQLSL